MIKKYIEMYSEEIDKSINDLKHKDTFYKQIPNLLTFSRLVGGLPAGLLYFVNPYLSIVAIVLLWFTDAIDGRIATKFNIKSKLGADMDAFADKIMFLGSSFPLLVNNPGIILNFILEGVISGINVAGRIKGLETKTVMSGKVKTVFLALMLVSGYLVQFFGFPAAILKILMYATVAFQTVAIKDYIDEFTKMNNELKENGFSNDDVIDISENVVLKEEDVLDKTKVSSIDRMSLDELTHERDFLLDFFEPDKVSNTLVRKREIGSRKR